MIGKTLDRFKITGRLGKGGMGEVYIAEDAKLSRRVALKILPAEVAADADRRARFEREARAVAALNHPNIVTIHSVDEDQGIHFLTMELVAGKGLGQSIPADGLELSRLLEVAVQLADAVAAAHDHGITHRDLKPDNVMITDEGRVKVLDFGLAKLAGPEAAPAGLATQAPTAMATQEGRIVGTVAYMSPEQAEGKPVDRRSDIFSLGILLYEMATGRKPFSGDTPMSTLSSIIKDTPAPIGSVKAALPRELGRIIDRCLCKDPEGRYPSASSLRDDLARLGAAAQRLRPSTGSTWWAVVAAIGLVAMAVVWMLRPEETKRAAIPAQRTVGVMGFENLSDSGDPENLGRILMGLITTDLAETGGMKVVSSSKILSCLRQAGLAAGGAFDASFAPGAARQAGVEVMLVGQVSKQDERLMLTAELVDVDSGNTLGSLREEADSSAGLFDLAGSLAQEMRERLGVAPADGNARSFDLARSLTRSTQAYRHYAAGELALHRGRFDAAAQAFGSAVEVDPTFALAWYRLSMAHSWGGHQQESLAALQEALTSIERLPRRWQMVFRASRAVSEGELGSAYTILEDLLATTDDLADAHNLLGEVLTHSARHWDPQRARRSLARALEIDPTFTVATWHLVEYDILAGNFEASRRLVEQMRETDPEDPMVRKNELRLLIGEGRDQEAAAFVETWPAAEAHLDWWERTTSWRRTGQTLRARNEIDRAIRGLVGNTRATAILARGMVNLDRGLFTAALEDFEHAADEMVATDSSKELIDETAEFLINRAQVLGLLGDAGEAVKAALRAISVSPYQGAAHYWLGATWLQSGRPRDAAAARAEFDKMAASSYSPALVFWQELLAAEEALSTGDLPAANALMAKIEMMPLSHRDNPSEYWLRGRIAEADGEPAAALAAYGRIRESHFATADTGLGLEIMALYRMGRMQEDLGRAAPARDSYRRFLDHWGRADRELPEADHARRRLAALGELP